MASIVDLSIAVEIIAGITVEAVAHNLNRNETVLRVLKRLNINSEPTSDDFDSIYVYTLVSYGVFKPEPILNFFRHEHIRDAFRRYFYEKTPDVILRKEAQALLDLNEENGILGRIDYDPLRELDDFEQRFRQLVHCTRSPADADSVQKIADLHLLVSDMRQKLAILNEESSTAQQLARDKPRFWEYLLTLELLRSRLAVIRRDHYDLRKGLTFQPSKSLDRQQYIVWGSQQMGDLSNLIEYLSIAIKDALPTSWGLPGEPGDVNEIKRAVDKIADACHYLVQWEKDIRFTNVPEEFQDIQQTMMNWVHPYLSEVERLPNEIGRPLQQANPEGSYEINLTFEAPPNIEQVRNDLFDLLG